MVFKAASSSPKYFFLLLWYPEAPPSREGIAWEGRAGGTGTDKCTPGLSHLLPVQQGAGDQDFPPHANLVFCIVQLKKPNLYFLYHNL